MRVDLSDHEEPEIGLVAMIDCIFFLLMFFMLATTFKQQETMKQQKELHVQLPVAEAAVVRAGAALDALVIGVDQDGACTSTPRRSRCSSCIRCWRRKPRPIRNAESVSTVIATLPISTLCGCSTCVSSTG